MTLRELVEYVFDHDRLTDVYTCIYNRYYYNKPNTLPDVIESYHGVMMDIIELPSYSDIENHILITSFEDDIGVSYFDTVDGQTYSIDFIDWSLLVDLMVEDRIGLSHHEKLAHVLWEITFHGFNRESIAEAAAELEQISKEEAVEFNLDDLDSI